MRKIFYLLMVTGLFTGLLMIQSCQSTKNTTASKMLKFNFEKGKGYDYEMTTNMDQEILGQQMKMDVTAYYSLDVVEDDGTTKTVNATIERFKMKMDMAGIAMDVDSEKPKNETGVDGNEKDMMKKVNQLFGAITGKQFTMKFNAEGKILDVTGFENMAQSIVDSMGIEGEEREQMVQQFDQQFNSGKMKEQFERYLYIFPNKEIKLGDKWEKNTDAMGMGNMKYNSTYTVTDIEGDMVTLDEKSILTSAEDQMTMKGDVKGKLIIDSRYGLVVSAEQDMKLTVEAMGQSVDITAKTKIKGKAR